MPELTISYPDITDPNVQNQIVMYAAPVGVFWTVLNFFQVGFGKMKFYSNKRGSFLLGMTTVATSSVISQSILSIGLFPYFKSVDFFKPLEKKEVIRLSIVTTIIYSTLGMSLCQSALPSSVITIGAFAKGRIFPYSLSGAIPSTSAVATPNQRAKIQKYGKIFGCHHCGSRQLFGKKNFIADHMPPTKNANEMNKARWRRWLGMEVKQALWPQCQSCFQQQGVAVMQGKHKLIYHFDLKLIHFSLLLALMTSYNPVFIHLSNLVMNTIKDAWLKLKQLLGS